jgi:hypothetical protein
LFRNIREDIQQSWLHSGINDAALQPTILKKAGLFGRSDYSAGQIIRPAGLFDRPDIWCIPNVNINKCAVIAVLLPKRKT